MKVVAKAKWFSILQANRNDEVVACADEVLVIAVDGDGNMLFVEEPSPAFGGRQLFLPGGEAKDGEDVLEAAQRELREETGFAAGKLELVGTLRPWPKYLQVTSRYVLATQLYPSPLTPDEDYPLVLHRKSRAQVQAMIADGEISDTRIVAAVGMWFP